MKNNAFFITIKEMALLIRVYNGDGGRKFILSEKFVQLCTH